MDIPPPLTLTLPRQFTGCITALAWSPDSTRLAVASSHGSIAIWETQAGVCLLERHVTTAALSALAWTRQGRCLLLGSEKGTLSMLHLASGKLVSSCAYAHAISRLAYAPSSLIERFFVVAGSLVQVFTVGQERPFTRRYATRLIDAAWCPGGRSIALLCENGFFEVWEIAARSAGIQATRQNAPRCLAWGATDQVIMLGTQRGHLQECCLAGASWQAEQAVSRFPLVSLSHSVQGIIAQSRDETVLWAKGSRTTLARRAHAVALNPPGTALATAYAQGLSIAALC